MGNRAVITTFSGGEKDYGSCTKLGIYVHWNGGYDSVRAFLTYCRMKGYASPGKDNYGWARLAQVIANFFDDGLSVGIDNVCKLDYDNYDNGVYVIKDWQIVDRKFMHGSEQHGYDLRKMLLSINEKQPQGCRLKESEIDAKLKEYFPDGYDTPKRKNYYGVQQTFDDRGNITIAVVVKYAEQKPQPMRSYLHKHDVHMDWFDTKDEALAFIDEATEA